MPKDIERIEKVQETLRWRGLDGLICAAPSNVLMLTGYWPVIGQSLAIVNAAGQVTAVVPEDERSLAERGWSEEVLTFQPGPLDRLVTFSEAIRDPLGAALEKLNLSGAAIGLETRPRNEPSTYVGTYRFHGQLETELRAVAPKVKCQEADAALETLRMVKTALEIEKIEVACRIAESAFRFGLDNLMVGDTEICAAQRFNHALEADDMEIVDRHGGWVFCLSGPGSVQASAAWQHWSTCRTIGPGEPILVHCNSYAGGFWTDITRSYCLRKPSARISDMVDAILSARDAALRVIRPGVRGREVDAAARNRLTDRGYGKEFKNPAGHGVGFVAIDHNARPRLHPASDDVLEVGMVFNLEPAIYIEGLGGMRHCDMVVVEENGPRMLTHFQETSEELIAGP